MADNWYAIQTKPNAEPTAYVGLGAKGFDVFYPVETLRTFWRGRSGSGAGTKTKSLFTGYIFARLDAGRHMQAVLETQGVEDILRSGTGKLSPVPDEIINDFRRLVNVGAFDRTSIGTWLKIGDNVKVVSGPFAGLVAKIKSAKSKQRIHILVDFVHNATVSIDKLEKICV